jgi:hypothetical protein
MTQHPFIDKLRGVMEIDETYVGGKEKGNPGIPSLERSKKVPVVALMERNADGSRVRSFPVERVTLANVKPIVQDHVEVGANNHFMRDAFPKHDVITHKNKQYSRITEDGRHVTTNTVEGYFGLFKRAIYGTYHHIGRGYM